MSDPSSSSGRNLQDASASAAEPPLNSTERKPTYSYSRTFSGLSSSGQQVQGISRQTPERPCLSILGGPGYSNSLEPIRIGSARQSLDTPAHIMESSTSPIVQIPQWYNKGPSTGFIHSPGVQVRLSQQSRVSPIDAFRNSSHPYTKNRPNMSSACSSRRGSASLAPGESDSNRNVPVSNGLKDSPRRKRRPDFPTSPRSIVRPDGDDYPMDSPLLDYTQTPSILRVPFTPLPLGLHPGTSGPQSPRLEYQAPASGLPMSSVRDSSPGKAVSSGSTRHKARMNAVSRDRPETDSIPRSYVLKSLNNLAPHFWNRPATADCRISESTKANSMAWTDKLHIL